MNPTSIPQSEARRLLADVETLRSDTRAGLRNLWFPLVVYGALTLLSAPFLTIWDGAAVALFWLVGAPLGWVLVSRHYCRRAQALGVHPVARPYLITGGALIVACFLLGGLGGALGSEILAAVGPPLAVSTAYVVFAWLDRSLAPALLAVALAGVAVAVVAAGVADPGPILALVYGASFLVLGLSLRPSSQR